MVKLVRNIIKSKFIYNGKGIAFEGKGSWSFGNDFARNAVIFGVDDSQRSHTDNRKNNFLVLGEGPTDGINDGTDVAGKKVVLILVKQRQDFGYVYFKMVIRVTCMEIKQIFANLLEIIT